MVFPAVTVVELIVPDAPPDVVNDPVGSVAYLFMAMFMVVEVNDRIVPIAVPAVTVSPLLSVPERPV